MDSKIEILLKANGYTNVVYIESRGWCGIDRSFMFTVGLCYGMDEYGRKGRYCFPTYKEAVEALENWNGIGDPEGDWIVHKHRAGEFGNPNRE